MKLFFRDRSDSGFRPSRENADLVTQMSPLLKDFAGSSDISSLLDVFGRASVSLGFPNYAISRISMTHLKSRPRILTETICVHYPENWIHRYRQHDYGSIDPVHRAAFTRFVPYRWDDITDLNSAERQILDEARDAGLTSGLSVPIREVGGNILLFNLSAPANHGCIAMNLQLATIISMLFYLGLDRLVQSSRPAASSVRLSSRQRECLLWVARGKTSDEISTILEISHHTVNYHIAEAMKALNVNRRTTAAVYASVYGLIDR
ncbi:autoinducer binding domain-containing protein [Paraburkholderia kururiensis]|uniref:autoinducer binding domain-containing protein n=1 Tax=Paraburkholderia kururiensis TaxID=984307 RepID=UPI0039A43B0A